MKRRDARRGFALVELLIVLTIISLLIRVALPAYDGIRRDSIATQAAGDFNTVRAAAVAQFEATGNYPADAPSGVVPAGLTPYLPRNFSFRKPHYELDWENFAVSDSTSSPPMSGQVLALTVTASDSRTGLQILHTLGANCTHWSVGDSHTFVVFSTLESPH
jgi:prepilin-type N-terminal cleavage/methylation domain-containing protein